MTRSRNGNRRWSPRAVSTLRSGARSHATTASIARKVHRTKSAVRAKASRLHISLKPKDK